MKDFNLAKYLRENYQGSFSMFQPYVDLNPLKEESEEQLDAEIPYEGPDPHLDGMGSDFEQADPVEEGNAYPKSEEDVIRRLKKDIGKKVYFDWVDMVDYETNETILDGALADDEGYPKYTYDEILAAAKKYYKIREGVTSRVEEAFSAEQEKFDRMMGFIDRTLEAQLPKIKRAVDKARDMMISDKSIFNMLATNSLTQQSVQDLVDDGFDKEDIVDFFATDFSLAN